MRRSVELAPAKARTATVFGRPSRAREDAIHVGRIAAATAGVVVMALRVPLMRDGVEVGAIGVSTTGPEWDNPITAACTESLTKQP